MLHIFDIQDVDIPLKMNTSQLLKMVTFTENKRK